MNAAADAPKSEISRYSHHKHDWEVSQLCHFYSSLSEISTARHVSRIRCNVLGCAENVTAGISSWPETCLTFLFPSASVEGNTVCILFCLFAQNIGAKQSCLLPPCQFNSRLYCCTSGITLELNFSVNMFDWEYLVSVSGMFFLPAFLQTAEGFRVSCAK